MTQSPVQRTDSWLATAPVAVGAALAFHAVLAVVVAYWWMNVVRSVAYRWTEPVVAVTGAALLMVAWASAAHAVWSGTRSRSPRMVAAVCVLALLAALSGFGLLLVSGEQLPLPA